jgi:hypothetical protein
MNRLLTTFCFVIVAKIAISQGTYKFPVLPAKAAQIEGFFPKGWHLLYQTEGDLNKDQLSDAAFIIEGDTEVKNLKEDNTAKPRILAMVFKQNNGDYVLSTQANDFIMLSNEGGILGDPLADIQIQRGSVLVSFYGGSSDRWGYDYRFRFQNNNWFLIGATYLSHSTLNGYSKRYDFNLITGLLEYKEGRGIDEGATPDKTVKQNIGKKPLRSLKQLEGDNQWNIYKDIYF